MGRESADDVARRIGAAATVHLVPVLNRLSAEERQGHRAVANAQQFADIGDLDAVDAPEELDELAESVADWVAHRDRLASLATG